MRARAVVVGESLVDLIEVVHPDLGTVLAPRAGGSPLNVAVGVRRLGTRATLVTSIGGDGLGRRLRGELDREGVEVITAEATLLRTVASLATRTGDDVDYEYLGDPADMLRLPFPDAELFAAGTVVHIGSTVFHGGDALKAADAAFGADGVIRVMDPNPRPALIGDPRLHGETVRSFMARADLVKLSREDARLLFPGEDLIAVVDRVLDTGAGAVVVTGAASPTAVATAAGLAWVEVPRIPVVDPTGGGDSFTAAAVDQIARHGLPDDLDGWQLLTRRANTAASITCSAWGAAAAMPHREELERRLGGLGG